MLIISLERTFFCIFAVFLVTRFSVNLNDLFELDIKIFEGVAYELESPGWKVDDSFQSGAEGSIIVFALIWVFFTSVYLRIRKKA